MRRVCALAVGVLVLLVISGAGAGYGTPPGPCKPYEAFVSDQKCLIQSHAATFSLFPHEVRVGDTITAKLVSSGSFDLVRVNWDTLTLTLGTRLCGVGFVDLGKGKETSCKFKVLRPTNAWVTVILGFGTTIGPAQSRDYFAASASGKTTTTVQAEMPEENKPPIPSFVAKVDELKLTVDGSDSRDPDGRVVRYSWSADGKAIGHGRKVDEHTFADSGRYEISLTVTDNKGASRSTSRSVCVSCSDPDGVDWLMPKRLEKSVENWGSHLLLDRASIHPKAWEAELFLTAGGEKIVSCPADVQWRWTVAPPAGARVLTKPPNECTPSMRVSDLGTYDVSATKYTKKGGAWTKTGTTLRREVIVRDWLIVGLGDSNGSGEGNPPFKVDQCNRSIASYQYQAARYIEAHDPRTSVTFIIASCSGAIIENLVDLPYVGIRPRTPIDPQVAAVGNLLGPRVGVPGGPKKPRVVDAAILSIGVNNIGFGPLMEFCVISKAVKAAVLGLAADLVPACQAQHVRVVEDGKGRITQFKLAMGSSGASTLRASLETLLLEDLPPKYEPLAQALASPVTPRLDSGMGMTNPHRVFITQYPDFTSGEGGTLCEGGLSLASWPKSTWQWLSVAAARLNQIVAAAATAQNWTPVPVSPDAFAGHGYCASDSYFVGIVSAKWAGDDSGPFHPNVRGHAVTALATRLKICAALYGNPDCDGLAKR